MATGRDLQDELEQIEQEITQAKAKYEKQKAAIGEEPDTIELKVLQQREETIHMLEEKRKELLQRIAQQMKSPKQPVKGRDLDEDEHLSERSTLRYGNVIDLEELDIDEPAGGSADWLAIGIYIFSFPVQLLLKTLYILTTRGRQTIKENKGNRLRFKDSSSTMDVNGVKTPRHLYISLPTAQSSMKTEEITPGRYRTVACGILSGEMRARKLVSPVMGVIGFNYLAEKWGEYIDAFLMKQSPHLPVSTGSPESATNFAYLIQRQDVLNKSKTVEYLELWEQAEKAGRHLVDRIESPLTPWLFAGSPDRCPPTSLYVAGIAELGAFFSILQDIRNAIMASKLVGTAEEKLKRKSSFYQSYLRRTQSMGIQLDQRIIILYMMEWGKMMVDHFHLGDDMDSELRKACQSLIDEKVAQVSNQEALKL
uniref:Nucleoprotein n=1 Tax=Longquan virus TaxID=1283294 RepID=M9QY17_9VIRU|nr:nucleocapsid [Longquan virus]